MFPPKINFLSFFPLTYKKTKWQSHFVPFCPKAWCQYAGNDMTILNMFCFDLGFVRFFTYCTWKTALAPFAFVVTAQLVPNISHRSIDTKKIFFDGERYRDMIGDVLKNSLECIAGTIKCLDREF